MQFELRSEIWVSALLRRAQAGGAMALLSRRGDRDGGAVLVKVATLDGRASVYAPARNGDGERVFMRLRLEPEEAAADAYLARRAASDPDVWVVDIEDRQGRHFLTEPVEEG
jgi:hypothetical protein